MRPNVVRTAVIADPYPMWCDALTSLLDSLGVTAVARAASADELATLLEEHQPDLLIGDCVLLLGDGGDTLDQARAASPGTRWVVLSERMDDAEREAVFSRGGWAYCAKSAEPDDLGAAIRQLFAPSIYFADALPHPTLQIPASISDALSGLTKREIEVLRLAADGHSNSELARELWVTEQTVKFHLSNIYRKLGVANRTEASHWALKHGLLEAKASTEAA